MTRNLHLDMISNVDQITIHASTHQQDGTPLHYNSKVRGSLKQAFPEQWIACTEAPTSMDFFLWGFMHNTTY
jgi:hypothetical protein